MNTNSFLTELPTRKSEFANKKIDAGSKHFKETSNNS